MSNITFETTVTVKLDGKLVGRIKHVQRTDGIWVWKYFPTGCRPGLSYPTLEACQNSLKG